jgi:hypothetical protein
MRFSNSNGKNLDRTFHVYRNYHDPHEIILNMTNYYEITHSNEIQNILKIFLKYKIILFIGCGSRLKDPNFNVLLK